MTLNGNIFPAANNTYDLGGVFTGYARCYIHIIYRASQLAFSSYKVKKNIDRILVEDTESSGVFAHGFDNSIAEDIVRMFTNVNYYLFNYIGSDEKKLGVIIEEIEDVLEEGSDLRNLLIKKNSEPVFSPDNEIIGYTEKKFLNVGNLDMTKGVMTKRLFEDVRSVKNDINDLLGRIS